MALDEITFFEVHLDGTEIGKKLGGSSEKSGKAGEKSNETSGKKAAGEQQSSGGSGRKRAIIGTVLALAIFGVVAYRRRKSGQTTMDDYTDRDSEGGLADSDTVELDDASA